VGHVGGRKVFVSMSMVDDRREIATMLDAFRANHSSAVSVIVSGSSSVHVGVTDDLVSQGLRAGDLARIISTSTGGSGGGRPHFASGSIGDPTKVPSTSTIMTLVSGYLEQKK
jgi:alanyl-tRNA synthetase